MSEKTGLSGLQINRQTEASTSIPAPPRKWLTRLALPLAILLIALALLGYAARDSLRPAVPVPVIQVISKTTTSTAAVGSATVQAPGWVEADPFPIYVPALAAGVVKEVLVLEGERVHTDQVVARLIDDDARLSLQQAQARLADKEAHLRAAQTDWDHPIELDRRLAVSNAAVQQIIAEQLQLTSEIATQAAKLAEFEDKHQRLNALGPESAAKQQVIQMGLQRDAQKAMLVATETRQAVLAARLLNAQANQDAAREQRQLRIQQRENLDRAGAEVQLAQANLAEAQLRVDRMDVRSPAEGIVMTRLAVPGSKVMLEMDHKLSANVVHLYDPNKLQVRVDVPLADAALVGIDQPAEITVDVLPDTPFAGHVTRIVHEADIQKNTLEVKVAIHDPSAQVKPEMLARVKFFGRNSTTSKSHSSARIFVPERLVQERSGDQAWVWLASAKRRAEKRSITLGQQVQDSWIETVSGLQPGDLLIDRTDLPLKEGQSLRITGDPSL